MDRDRCLGTAGRGPPQRFLEQGWIFYLYHPQILIAHVNRLEGFKPMPDGLVRVVGLKMK